MEEVFVNNANDKGLSILLKREANIVLASLDKYSFEYKFKKEHFQTAISVIKEIELKDPQNSYDIAFIIDTINRIWKIGLLAPLTLKDDEFSANADSNGYKHNIRYHYIYKDTNLNDAICNDNAFNIYARTAYNHRERQQIKFNTEPIRCNGNIYISKGGVVTGEYIKKCIIRQDVVDKHIFTIQSIVKLPVCAIFDDSNCIFIVDHREPKLKVLKQFYEIPIYKDDNIADKHYDIRKYDKLM